MPIKTESGYRISNTHASKNGSKYSAVKVYSPSDDIIANIKINKYNPLKYIRDFPLSDYAGRLKEACKRSGMPENEFESVFGFGYQKRPSETKML